MKRLLLTIWHNLPSNRFINPIYGLVRENHYFKIDLLGIKKIVYID